MGEPGGFSKRMDAPGRWGYEAAGRGAPEWTNAAQTRTLCVRV